MQALVPLLTARGAGTAAPAVARDHDRHLSRAMIAVPLPKGQEPTVRHSTDIN